MVKSIVAPLHSSTETSAFSSSATTDLVAPSSAAAASQLPSGAAVESDASLTMTSSAPAGDNSLVATLTVLHGLADKMFLNALNCQGKAELLIDGRFIP